MPLPDPAPREPVHTRRVECRGFRRADGLWDIEGHLVDTKAYAFPNAWRGTLEPGDPVHEMRLRLTVDDSFTVREVAAATDASPYAVCPTITPAFQALVGLQIGPGWSRAVRERLGGVRGCTHLVELLGPIATTAFQSIYPILLGGREHSGGTAPETPPKLLNTCHAYRADGEIVRRIWPTHYTGPKHYSEPEDRTHPGLSPGPGASDPGEGDRPASDAASGAKTRATVS